MPDLGSFAVAALLGVTAAFSQATGSIQGTVANRDTGRPLADALVVARAMPASSTRQSVRLARDGSFLLQNLPPGVYSLCVRAVDDGHLDPCEWGQNAPTITLAAGQRSTGNVVTVPSGSVVKIRIQDASQLLFQKTRTGFVPDLLVGVFGPRGLFYPAHVAKRDIHGVDLQMTIPFDMPLFLSVHSRAARLADANGAAVPVAGARTALQHGRGDPHPRSFTFTVTGVNP